MKVFQCAFDFNQFVSDDTKNANKRTSKIVMSKNIRDHLTTKNCNAVKHSETCGPYACALKYGRARCLRATQKKWSQLILYILHK